MIPLELQYNNFLSTGCKNCANVAPDVFGIEEDLEEPEHIVSVGNLN